MDQNTTTAYLGLFECLKTLLFSEAFQERHRQKPKNFTRQRCLPFVIVVIFLLNLVKRALQDELDEFFKLLTGAEVAVRLVTKSAFIQARKKLKYEAFVELNQTQVNYFYAHFEVATWHGLRLIATDGSMSELPNTPEVCTHFGVWHPAAGGTCPKARVSQMFDVLNKVSLEARLAPKASGERDLAALHFAYLQAGDLALLDRGYPAFWLFALILTKHAHFCARMKLSGWKVVEQFVASGKDEQIVTVQPGAAAIQECHARKLPSTPLSLRLIRIELDSGEIEVLATSLLDGASY
ncbi:MAG: IS4/IS5 family transposase, partial [Desulfovibrio sp.]|nr:IS4/IS5 family transposase [Desulfovibrio sp.]